MPLVADKTTVHNGERYHDFKVLVAELVLSTWRVSRSARGHPFMSWHLSLLPKHSARAGTLAIDFVGVATEDVDQTRWSCSVGNPWVDCTHTVLHLALRRALASAMLVYSSAITATGNDNEHSKQFWRLHDGVVDILLAESTTFLLRVLAVCVGRALIRGHGAASVSLQDQLHEPVADFVIAKNALDQHGHVNAARTASLRIMLAKGPLLLALLLIQR
mmetsp:Transcript_44977/g.106831  ORF Transcript_44977/g.106831 Transcript_44977/m.106831 type:complete len:218 (+) Transcript_44977:767-1420(+)